VRASASLCMFVFVCVYVCVCVFESVFTHNNHRRFSLLPPRHSDARAQLEVAQRGLWPVAACGAGLRRMLLGLCGAKKRVGCCCCGMSWGVGRLLLVRNVLERRGVGKPRGRGLQCNRRKRAFMKLSLQ
jgi:hypothetical protein